MPPEPDSIQVTEGCPIVPWRGSAWRVHHQRYAPTDHGGSLRFSGRYHQAMDLFPFDQTWPALYLALRPEVALGEVIRHVASASQLPRLNQILLSEVAVDREAVLDLRSALAQGVTLDTLCRDLDYRLTQALASAAIACGVEGVVVPSCTLQGENLIVFPRQPWECSLLTMVSSRSLRLYVERPE